MIVCITLLHICIVASLKWLAATGIGPVVLCYRGDLRPQTAGTDGMRSVLNRVQIHVETRTSNSGLGLNLTHWAQGRYSLVHRHGPAHCHVCWCCMSLTNRNSTAEVPRLLMLCAAVYFLTLVNGKVTLDMELNLSTQSVPGTISARTPQHSLQCSVLVPSDFKAGGNSGTALLPMQISNQGEHAMTR